jgi:predicted alpha/beta superfamily hydrolase
MKRCLCALLIAAAVSVPRAGMVDGEHYSKTFKQKRKYRIYLPRQYGTQKGERYPVIYYCHGSGGRYAWDAYEKDSLGRYPYVGEFTDFSTRNNTIIVCVDGYLGNPTEERRDGIPFNTRPYYDEYSPKHKRYKFSRYFRKAGGFRFSDYIRELVAYVDSEYRTKPDPQFRGISGLSMGGHTALFLTANNPDLFRSVSTFCHSPAIYAIGLRPYRTYTVVKDLWRNLKGVSVRTTQNTQDYLSYYDKNLARYYRSAGMDYEYHIAIFWRHYAVDIDSQFLFHLKTFKTPKERPAIFSHANLYPSFNVWDYSVITGKKEPGWLVLENVSDFGLNAHTTDNFFFRRPLSNYAVTVKTAPRYKKNSEYTITDYDFNRDRFKTYKRKSDAQGVLTVNISAGKGHAVGILPADAAMVTPWPPEFNTALFIEEDRDTVIPLTVVNKGNIAAKFAKLEISTLNNWIKINQPGVFLEKIDAGAKTTVNEALSLRITEPPKIPVGAVTVRIVTEGNPNYEEMTVPVQAVYKSPPVIPAGNLLYLDGRQVEVNLYAPYRFAGKGKMLRRKVTGGRGNGNGVPEKGERFVILVREPMGVAANDTNSYHPVFAITPVKGLAQDSIYIFKNAYDPLDVPPHNRAQSEVGGVFRIIKGYEPGQKMLTVRKIPKVNYSKGARDQIEAFVYRYGVIEL